MELTNTLMGIVVITIGALGAATYFIKVWSEISADRKYAKLLKEEER